MDYLVIELKDEPHIICTNHLLQDEKHIHPNAGKYNSGGNPMIFKDKNTAFRIADECKQGLVYPITNVMKIFEQLKQICRTSMPESDGDRELLEELLLLTDDII